jgi:hypothetical protein
VLKKPRSRRAVLLLACALLATVVGAAGVAPATRVAKPPRSFRLVDSSAGCALAKGILSCRSIRSTRTLAISATGNAKLTTAAVVWDPSTPVLRTWRRSGIACRVARGAIACVNRSGALITAGATGIAVSLAPVYSAT